jgi:hypothetical protein
MNKIKAKKVMSEAKEMAKKVNPIHGLPDKFKIDAKSESNANVVMPVTIKESEKVKIYDKVGVEFYNLTQRKSKFSFAYWKDKWKRIKHADKIVLIHFELSNGFHRQFLAKEKEGGFNYKDKLYIFDLNFRYYDIDAQLWCYDYHENFTLPIKRSIPIEEIKKYIFNSGVTDVEYATNPSLLEKFIDSKIIEAIMRGAQLDEWMKQMRVLIIITLFVASIHLIIFVFKSGMLQSIKIPGFG